MYIGLTVLFPFVGILVGLGVADLVFSVHRSIRAGRRWHGLPAAWVAFTFLLAALYWWTFADIAGEGDFRTLLQFAFHLVTPLLLVLTCAAALPDGDGGGDPDLLEYYFRNRRYFFGLYAVLFVHIALDYGFNHGSWDRPAPWGALAFSLATASLAVVGRLAYHAVVTAVLLGLLLVGSSVLGLSL